MATIHAYLLNQHKVMDDPTDSIIYGPSTSNKIERWWRDLHERLEKFFKVPLTVPLRGGEHDPHSALNRQLLAYVFIPIVQRRCDMFGKCWNSHRIRGQENLEIPTGVGARAYVFFPWAIWMNQYGDEIEQWSVTTGFCAFRGHGWGSAWFYGPRGKERM